MGTSLYNALKVKEPEAYSRNGKETGVAGAMPTAAASELITVGFILFTP